MLAGDLNSGGVLAQSGAEGGEELNGFVQH